MKTGRNNSLLQVLFSGPLTDGGLAAHFRRAAADCCAQLDQLRLVPALANSVTGQIHNPRDTWCWFSTLDYGLRQTATKPEEVPCQH
jgi:hypothetical protein